MVRKILGMIISVCGLCFFIRPDFNLFEASETILYILYTYWPLILIFTGLYLQRNTPKRKRR